MKNLLLAIVIAFISHVVTLKPEPLPVYAETVPKQKVNEVIKPVVAEEVAKWTVSSSPNTKVSVAQINYFLENFKNRGLSKEGASYLIGNFITESYLTSCEQSGDGGLALGLAQWHPSRRQDMPCDLNQQIEWAFSTEMVRDSSGMGYTCVCESVKTNDIDLIKSTIQKWERWGELGNRWEYSQNIYEQIKAQ